MAAAEPPRPAYRRSLEQLNTIIFGYVSLPLNPEEVREINTGFEIFPEVEGEFVRLYTGHGGVNDCLIHTFLMDTCENFRNLSYLQKTICASDFRRGTGRFRDNSFLALSKLTPAYARYSQATKRDTDAKIAGNGFLDDTDILLLSQIFNINFGIFNVLQTYESQGQYEAAMLASLDADDEWKAVGKPSSGPVKNAKERAEAIAAEGVFGTPEFTMVYSGIDPSEKDAGKIAAARATGLNISRPESAVYLIFNTQGYHFESVTTSEGDYSISLERAERIRKAIRPLGTVTGGDCAYNVGDTFMYNGSERTVIRKHFVEGTIICMKYDLNNGESIWAWDLIEDRAESDAMRERLTTMHELGIADLVRRREAQIRVAEPAKPAKPATKPAAKPATKPATKPANSAEDDIEKAIRLSLENSTATFTDRSPLASPATARPAPKSVAETNVPSREANLKRIEEIKAKKAAILAKRAAREAKKEGGTRKRSTKKKERQDAAPKHKWA